MQQLCWQIYFRCKIQMLGMKRLMNFYRSSLIFWRYSVFGPIFSGTTCEAPISSFSNTICCKLSAIMITKNLSSEQDLLGDAHPTVRATAIHGVCRITGVFWELIPAHIIKMFLTKLVGSCCLLVSEKLNAETPMKLRASVKYPCDPFNKWKSCYRDSVL